MNSKKRYLTKSKFKEGLDCPTKLFYSQNSQYFNKQQENSFLEALAEGGYQVGELAKFLISEAPYKKSITIDTLDTAKAIDETLNRLESESSKIAEAAFNYQDLLVRVDLVVKNGAQIDLYEVKSKSWGHESVDDVANSEFIKTMKRGKNKGKQVLDSGWKPYLYDIAFQRYVVKKLYPDHRVKAHLILADKSATSTIDGLNQFFKIQNLNGQKSIIVNKNLTRSELGQIPLKVINVDFECTFVEQLNIGDHNFESLITKLSNIYTKKQRVWRKIDHNCFNCQYRNDNQEGTKSGFHECMEHAGYRPQNTDSFVEEIWRGTKKETDLGHFLISEVDEHSYLESEIEDSHGMSTNYRQFIQIYKSKTKDSSPFYHEYLSDVIESLEEPYHFIDFETSSVAIPFHKNRSPYEATAFQYSYHLFDSGNIKHQGEFINLNPEFPNYEFVRSLKNEFSPDLKGTIFRYHNHENTILNKIYTQLLEESSIDVPDRNELLDFIKEISKPTKSNNGAWKESDNCMVDLYKLIVSLYYSPYSKGSNSIKYILPSAINDSSLLKSKYTQPIYGSSLIPSKNFTNHQWITNNQIDPYKTLPPIFSDEDDQLIELMHNSGLSFESINDGGAAMTAYAFLQFSNTDEKIKNKMRNSLLKYCELDTMAMVMIFEHLLEKAENRKPYN